MNDIFCQIHLYDVTKWPTIDYMLIDGIRSIRCNIYILPIFQFIDDVASHIVLLCYR